MIPNVFRQYFPKLTAIINCTELFIDHPKTYKARVQVYSNYKKHSTAKFLIACTLLGSVSFISQAWVVVLAILIYNSGVINPNSHHHDNQILADHGFPFQDEFAAGCGVELIIPSFTN